MEAITADIFERLKSGEAISMDDEEYHRITEVVNTTIAISQKLNNTTDTNTVRRYISSIIGASLEESTTIFPPFHTNFGKFITIGKNVFINHDCSMLDLGGITIEDDVLIGPRVSIVTENHPLDPKHRRTLVTKPVIIKRNAWIGAGAIILAGVTIGENAVVAAGAVVNKDVAHNAVVAGVPAKTIKSL